MKFGPWGYPYMCFAPAMPLAQALDRWTYLVADSKIMLASITTQYRLYWFPFIIPDWIKGIDYSSKLITDPQRQMLINTPLLKSQPLPPNCI